ncbi:hypothetical protein DFH29DRAFT_950155 [Suillus ampliporus]|nr:hypothetical protein DFH29DRAFT_950155 [Suillus ampliporus]
MTFSHNIRLWDTKTGEPLNPSLQKYADIWCGAFSLDGKCFASSEGKTIRLWDVEIGTTLRPPAEGHVDSVGSVTVSPDGTDIPSRPQDLTICPHDARAIPNHDLQHFIRFSLDPAHALVDTSALLDEITSATQDTLVLPVNIRKEDRWAVIGSKERLLFWVPPTYDPCWCPPRVRWVVPLDTPLDLSHMAHGVSWKSCYRTRGQV